ncbi:MAG: FtsQ-type POTRA domain-containing protein [Candidatus Krumholzibacteriia bacterium]
MAAMRRPPADTAFAMRRVPRRRRGPLAVRTAAVLLGVAVLAALGWWLLTADLFAVTRVETGAYRFTDKGELERALQGLLGRNIWRVGADDARAALAPLPWLRDLRLSRRLPGRLAVEFTEWRPLLALEGADGAGGPAVLVGDGRVLPFPQRLPAPGLPVLVGVRVLDEPDGTRRLEPAQLPRVLEVLAAIESTGLETAVPVDFVVARAEGFAIVLQEGRGTLLVGREEFAHRLQRYMVGRDHLEPGLEVDLRFRDKITVRRPDGPQS